MRDTETVLEFLDGDYEFDEAAFRADTIDNFPRVDDGTDAESTTVEGIPAADD